MNIDEILNEWANDKNIDNLHLDKELLKLSTLHHKYIAYYMEVTKDQLNIKKRIGKLKQLKIQYYKGMMDKNILKQLGWEQYQGLKPQSSNEWDMTLKNDSDLLEIQDHYDTNEAMLKLLESILWHVRDRGNHLKTIIDYQRFLNG